MTLESLTNLSLTFTRMLLGIIVLSATVIPQIVPEFVIHVDTSRSQSSPSLVFDEESNLYIVWASENSTDYSIFDADLNEIRDYTNLHNLNQWDNVYRPRIAAGNITKVVVWTRNEPGSTADSPSVRGQLLNAGGNPIEGNIFEAFAQDNDSNPAVAFLNDSTFLMVWERRGNLPDGIEVYGQLMTTSLTQSGDPFMVSTDSLKSQETIRPRIASSSNIGNAVVVWKSNRDDIDRIQGQLLNNSGILHGGTFLISELTRGMHAGMPNVAMHDDGRFVVVWAVQEDTIFTLRMKRYNPDGTSISEIIKVNDGPSLAAYQVDIDVAFDETGQILIIWNDWPEGYSQLQFQRFDSNGIKIGKNIDLHTVGTAQAWKPAIAIYSGKVYLVKVEWRDLELPTRILLSVWDFENPLDIQGKVNPFPTKFSLYPAYPNPFNANTAIPFELSSSADKVLLTIYDIRGRILMESAMTKLFPGQHSFEWAGNDQQGRPLPTGIYIYSLNVDGQIQAKKMSLLK